MKHIALCTALLLLGHSLATSSQPPAASSANSPTISPTIRGLWVDSFGIGLHNPQEISDIVSVAQKMGANVIFAQIGRRGDCYCNKASVPRVEDPALEKDFDPLENLLEQAHAAHIQVHAWMTTTSIRSDKVPLPKNPLHVWNAHGEDEIGLDNWLIYRRDGTAVESSDYYLDVSNPYASSYIAEMYASIVKNYAVDGIMLDRVRYPDDGQNVGGGNFWGYSDPSLSRFWKETGAKGAPKPNDPRWLEWRREQVNALVRRITLEVKAIRPTVWVSAATIAYGAAPKTETEFQKTRTYSEVLQDWVQWSKSGWIDLNVTMNYKVASNPNYVKWFDGWNSFAATLEGPKSARQASGTALYLNTVPDSLGQAQKSLSSLKGWVAYSYRTPSSAGESTRNATWDALAAGLKSENVLPLGDPKVFSAVRGTLSQNKRAAVLAPQQHLTGRAATGIRLELWTTGANGRKIDSVLSDGGGNYGFFNLPAGPLELRIKGLKNPVRLERKLGEVLTLPVVAF